MKSASLKELFLQNQTKKQKPVTSIILLINKDKQKSMYISYNLVQLMAIEKVIAEDPIGVFERIVKSLKGKKIKYNIHEIEEEYEERWRKSGNK